MADQISSFSELDSVSDISSVIDDSSFSQSEVDSECYSSEFLSEIADDDDSEFANVNKTQFLSNLEEQKGSPFDYSL